jgi:hypothetical protein
MSQLLSERRRAGAPERWEPFQELDQVTERMRRMLEETFGAFGRWPSLLPEAAGWSSISKRTSRARANPSPAASRRQERYRQAASICMAPYLRGPVVSRVAGGDRAGGGGPSLSGRARVRRGMSGWGFGGSFQRRAVVCVPRQQGARRRVVGRGGPWDLARVLRRPGRALAGRGRRAGRSFGRR